MHYSYGIMDQRKILLYKPQLFRGRDDVLIFPSANFEKWHGNIKEYIDAIYQIDSINKGKDTISTVELNLTTGLLHNINQELENLFNQMKTSENSYQYISTLEEKYKERRKNNYSSDMRKCDIRIAVKPEITSAMKYRNIMEIIDYANRRFSIKLISKPE